jgi:hypothetical protein
MACVFHFRLAETALTFGPLMKFVNPTISYVHHQFPSTESQHLEIIQPGTAVRIVSSRRLHRTTQPK